MSKKRKWEKIDYTRFVEVWQTSATLNDVVRIMNRTKNHVCLIAARLRKNGVPLRRFNKQPRYNINYEALRKLSQKQTHA